MLYALTLTLNSTWVMGLAKTEKLGADETHPLLSRRGEAACRAATIGRIPHLLRRGPTRECDVLRSRYRMEQGFAMRCEPTRPEPVTHQPRSCLKRPCGNSGLVTWEAASSTSLVAGCFEDERNCSDTEAAKSPKNLAGLLKIKRWTQT